MSPYSPIHTSQRARGVPTRALRHMPVHLCARAIEISDRAEDSESLGETGATGLANLRTHTARPT